MGCDFYTYYIVCIEYKKGDTIEKTIHKIEESVQRHWYWEGYDSRDEDSETWDEYRARVAKIQDRQVQEALLNYIEADLYKDGEWLCFPNEVEDYMELLSEYEIDEGSLIRVWEEGDYHYR